MIEATSVYLTDEQRETLKSLISAGSAPARVQTRARILLLADRNAGSQLTDQQIADAALCNKNTAYNVRHRFIQEGLERALRDKPRPGAAAKITAEVEAHLIALSCSDPPDGYTGWTLRLLADKAVELGLVESISHVAVGNRLKQTR